MMLHKMRLLLTLPAFRMIWMALDRPSIYANVPLRTRHSIPADLWPIGWPDDLAKDPTTLCGEGELFSYLRPLIILYSRVVDFCRVKHGVKLVVDYQALDAEIDSWFLSLPPAIGELASPSRTQQRRPSLPTPDALGNFWFAFSVSALGLHARGILRKWLLSVTLAEPDQVISAASFALDDFVRINRQAFANKVLQDALQVADSLSNLLQRGLETDPSLTPPTPHLTMGIYQVGLIYIMALGAAAVDGDEPMIARCESGLDVYERTLSALGRHFAPALRCASALSELHLSAQRGRDPGV